MRFKIKTLDSSDFNVVLHDSKTVWELKRRVCRLRGVWLHPENQRLLYAGHVLEDHKQLRAYCIDERKFLLMLPNKPSSSQSSSSTSATAENKRAFKAPTTPMYIPTDVIKEHIMKLGPWKESDVRRALLISLNNPNRAIDYLTFEQAPFQRMISPPSSGLFLSQSYRAIQDSVSIPKSPELQTKCNIGCAFKDYSSVEQQASNENIMFKLEAMPSTLEIRDSLKDIRRLVRIGFPRGVVLEAYEACDKDVEKTALLLCEQYVDEKPN